MMRWVWLEVRVEQKWVDGKVLHEVSRTADL